ncbi:hypothetical protein Q3G72_029155 [Acer saccharum]|nr:hypothetical protein Q3G72_029155 [Acer saccharum]
MSTTWVSRVWAASSCLGGRRPVILFQRPGPILLLFLSGLVCFHSLPYWSASIAAAIPLLRRSCSIAGLVWIAHPSFAATVPLLFH